MAPHTPLLLALGVVAALFPTISFAQPAPFSDPAWVKIGTNVCYSSTSLSVNSFAPEATGEFAQFGFAHVSGYATCDHRIKNAENDYSPGGSNFQLACWTFASGTNVALLEVLHQPAGDTAAVTSGASALSYLLPASSLTHHNGDVDTAILTLTNSVTLTAGSGLWVTWSEPRSGASIADNAGTHCVDVYGQAPVPVCALPASEWLETEFMPELDATASGFVAGSPDLFQVVFSYHRKYFDVAVSSDGLTSPADLAVTTEEHTPSDCLDTYTVRALWGTWVDKCFRSEEGGASGFVVFTCKVEIDGKETLDPMRGTGLTREIHNELPFIVKFPKQVSASVSNLSAFKPVNLIAAIIRQEVSLDVSAVTHVDAKITLFTSVQYPFKLAVSSPTTVSIPANIVEDSFANSVDCVDPAVPDTPNPAVNDANACSQQWILDLQVDAGARCDIDGPYSVTFQAVCQPNFAASTDCPLLKDDQGETTDVFTVNFDIDSENFCAVVVDQVDLAASLAVFKDHAHGVPATNFIQSQTAYFVATASSDKVTIVKVSVDDIDLDITGGPAAGHYDLFTNGAIEAAGTAVSLAIENSDNVANGNADQAWFQLVVDAATFDVPSDGSSDFDITVTLNVEFKNAQGLVMLEEQRFSLLQAGVSSQPLAANVKAGFGGSDDVTDSALATAGAAGAAACAIAVAHAL